MSQSVFEHSLTFAHVSSLRAEERVHDARTRPEADPLGFVASGHRVVVPDHSRLQETLLEEMVHDHLPDVCSLDLRLHLRPGVDGHCRR